MALLTVKNVKLSGISACVPANTVFNKDYDWISEQERASLIKHTGVAERRIAPKNISTSDMCVAAAAKLIAALQWKKEEIDALLFVSQSGDYFIPATSVIMQNRLGLPKSCMALDIGLGCSGYVYGLSLAGSLLNSGGIKKVILMSGDKSTHSISPRDKSAWPLFGDAGTVTALEYDEAAPQMFFNLQSDGSGYENIIVRDGLTRSALSEDSLKYKVISEGIERRPIDLELNGTGIFDFALREVIPNIKQALSFAGTEKEKIDYFVMHQANLLMNETLRKMMKTPAEKVPYSIHKYGNTSSASIPLTVVTQLRKEAEEKKLNWLFCGFGVGLSWGTAIVETDKIICPELIEING